MGTCYFFKRNAGIFRLVLYWIIRLSAVTNGKESGWTWASSLWSWTSHLQKVLEIEHTLLPKVKLENLLFSCSGVLLEPLLLVCNIQVALIHGDFRASRECHSISLKNMSLATRIHPTDIVHQLLHDNLLVMKDENYFFRTWVCS